MAKSKTEKKKKPFVLQQGVFSALRRMHRRHPAYSETINRCKKEYFVKSKKGSMMRRVHFQCELCDVLVPREDFAIDHREPVVPLEGLPKYQDGPDYNVYIERLFCPAENLQGLCEVCHCKKTQLENKERRALKPKKIVTTKKKK